VTRADGSLVGFLSDRLLRRLLDGGEQFHALFLACDLAAEPLTVTPDDTLMTCLNAMAWANQDEIVVADPADSTLLAVLSHDDVMALFRRRIGDGFEPPPPVPRPGP